MTTQPSGGFTAKAIELAAELDLAITQIRAAADRGEISTREAADLRISAMEEHLHRVRALRNEYYPPEEDR